jgi:hypothetical protein
MFRPLLKIFGLIATSVVLAMFFSACSDSGASQEELDRGGNEGAAKSAQQSKVKKYPCGGPHLAVANQTCRFAANVKTDYYSKIGSGSGIVYSYSPIDGRYYTMHCTAGSPHVCTGRNGATAYFR